MIRRFNYTDRARINRKDVRITLREGSEGFSFDADLSALADYDLPPDSFVFVEAYRQTNWMRFNFGQVGAILPEANRLLSQFDSPEGLLFRVKVTPNGDIHTLLAEADEVPLADPELDQGERKPLLPVKPQKLGDEIYKLDFSGDKPLLLINSDAGHYTDVGRSPAFISLAMPGIFREILVRIILIENHDDDTNPDEWKSQWLKFALLYTGVGKLPGADDVDGRNDWIDKVVAAFAKQIQVRTKFAEFWEGEK